MGVITGGIYKAIRKSYELFPYKQKLCEVLKRFSILNDRLYRDFRFHGLFKVDIDDRHSFYMTNTGGAIENETFWKGLFVSWEGDTGWIWKQLCRSSDVIFDIGANTGVYSLVTKALNPSAKVYAFEPSVNTFKTLRNNNLLNQYDIVCEQLAMSNKNEEQLFYDHKEPNQTSASLSFELIKDQYQDLDTLEYMVSSMTLAAYIQSHNIDKIDLMKMDVEMHEPEVIEGFGQYLNLYKPIVVIEILSDKVADRLNDLIGEDFIKIHLTSENVYEVVPRFKFVVDRWNYLFFHKDLESKIRQQTSLVW